MANLIRWVVGLRSSPPPLIPYLLRSLFFPHSIDFLNFDVDDGDDTDDDTAPAVPAVPAVPDVPEVSVC